MSAGIDPRLEAVIAGGIPRKRVEVVSLHLSALTPVALSLVRVDDPELLGLSLCEGYGGVWSELQLVLDPAPADGGGSAMVWVYGEDDAWVACGFGRETNHQAVRATFRGESQVFPVVEGFWLASFWPDGTQAPADENEPLDVEPLAP